MLKQLRRVAPSALATLFVALLSRPAFAAEGWEAPFIEVLDSLTSGLGTMGSIILGIGIMALGAWAAMTGRMDWNRFIFVVIGGILVMAGPTAAKALMGGG